MATLTLGELAALLRPFQAEVSGEPSLTVLDVDQDSRSVVPGALFVARRGDKVDGSSFARDAVRRGAVAVMTDFESAVPELGCPVLRVRDLPRALAFAAEGVHGYPSQNLKVTGITGTNGKTTISWLVQRTLDELGMPCGRLGTLGFEFASRKDEGHLTTPLADGVSRSLALMRRLGATHAAMEVSSAALSQLRVEALTFEVAALSNLTHDHLDFHGSFEAYRAAKARLFQELSPRYAVLNLDDEFGRWLSGNTRARVVKVGSAVDADVSGAGLVARPEGVSGTLTVFGKPVPLRTRFVGQHNAENILVAIGIFSALGVDVEAASEALAHIEPVPGRLERCDGPDDDVVTLVDYAHTPDALERVLGALRPLSSGQIICVFGCGGDRDPAKRTPMGRAVGQAADYAIVTNDNPRTENPESIAEPIVLGLQQGSARFEVCLDRALAIERAVARATPGDIVLLAGKGHETYQIVGGRSLPFDDRQEARLALGRRRQRARGTSA
jgi:UDP-N-acetylmuramoyl-L-alanyl-D-glutamate--2,6-diaminopimelate ligase